MRKYDCANYYSNSFFMEIAGALSADVRERALRVEKLGVRLKNTKIALSDGS